MTVEAGSTGVSDNRDNIQDNTGISAENCSSDCGVQLDITDTPDNSSMRDTNVPRTNNDISQITINSRNGDETEEKKSAPTNRNVVILKIKKKE